MRLSPSDAGQENSDCEDGDTGDACKSSGSPLILNPGTERIVAGLDCHYPAITQVTQETVVGSGKIRSFSCSGSATVPSRSSRHRLRIPSSNQIHWPRYSSRPCAACSSRHFLDGLARQNHLAIAELSGEIQITALVVDPGLLPLAGIRIKNRNADAAQMGRILGGEIFLHHTAIENARDVVGAVAGFSCGLARPGSVPATNPEVELLLFRRSARIGWRSGRCGVPIAQRVRKTGANRTAKLQSDIFIIYSCVSDGALPKRLADQAWSQADVCECLVDGGGRSMNVPVRLPA